jgi:hypothetical protein
MSKIAVLIPDRYLVSKYTDPAVAFKAADPQLAHLGVVAGDTFKR